MESRDVAEVWLQEQESKQWRVFPCVCVCACVEGYILKAVEWCWSL